MESRTNKYRDLNEENSLRSTKNKSIYDTIYSTKDYDSVEETVTKAKPNEVDLSKLRELLKKEESDELQIIKKETPVSFPEYELDEEKKHDLRDILNKAKTTREEEPAKLRSLSNTEYDILKSINIQEESEENQKDELQKMIDTVNNTSAINKLNDKELSLGLLSDLEATVSVGEPVEEPNDIDKSFYTSSLGFTANDFEELRDINNEIQRDNKIIKALLIIILLLMIGTTVFVIMNFI